MMGTRKKTIITGFCVLLASLLIAGCESTAPRTDTLDEMDQVLADGANHIPVEPSKQTLTPEEISRALIPKMKVTPPPVGKGRDSKKDEQRFDISVSNVPADQFYMSLVEGTKYNIVVHPDLKGTISLNLKNVTIMEVMEAVRDVYGYEFERTGYGLRVLPNALETRIFQVDYLNVERTGMSSTTISSGTLQSGSNGSTAGVTGSGGSSTGGGSVSSSTGTQVTTNQPKTSFWKELELSVKSIIGNGEGRSVVISPQSGIVVVRAVPNELRDVQSYLEAAQLISQRQVILEAKILEVQLNDSFRSGVNWAALAGSFTLGMTGGGTSLENDNGYSDNRGFVPSSGQNLGQEIPISSFGGVFSLAIDSSKFSAFIELLKTQGSVQVLSSPRISTMNNQKAVIKVGQDEFFVTKVSSDSVTGTATNTTADIELTPFFSGIALDVTPQISDDNEVTLHIHPSVSRVNEQQKLLKVNGQDQSLPLARSTIRESDSIIRARNGQIVVIGGLMQDTIDDQDAKTPGAGDVPLFGNLFKHKSRKKNKSELIILLRPIVVDSDRRWREAINDSRHNIGNMRQDVLDWRRTESPLVE